MCSTGSKIQFCHHIFMQSSLRFRLQTGLVMQSRGQLFTEGVHPLLSILIQQICHKSFHKCPVGGYRSQWKCPIQPNCAPVERQNQCLVHFSGLTASDHSAICGLGWPALISSLCSFGSNEKKIRNKPEIKEEKLAGVSSSTTEFKDILYCVHVLFTLL